MNLIRKAYPSDVSDDEWALALLIGVAAAFLAGRAGAVNSMLTAAGTTFRRT